jgi:hypothetical protein
MTHSDFGRTSCALRRRSRLAAVIVVSGFVVFGFSGTALATVPDTSATGPSESTAPPTTEESEDTIPDDSAVPSDETLEEEDEGVDVAPVAIVGFILLLAIASWWMVRQDDVDDGPSPPPIGEPEWRADQIAP